MLIKSESDKIISILLLTSLMLFVFFPNVILNGKINILFLIIFSGVAFLYSFPIVKENKTLMSLLVILSFSSLLKYYVYNDVDFYRVSDVVRVLLCLVLFCLVFSTSRFYYFRSFALILLLAQLLVVFFQVIDFSFICFLYDSSKIGITQHDLTQFRYTGTLSNPNTLGVFFAFWVSLNITWDKRAYYYMGLLFFTFVSGSRTGFLMTLLAIFLYEMIYDFCYLRLGKLLTFGLVFLAVIGFFIYSYSSNFYYFAQISFVVRDFFNGEGFNAFRQVSSLMTRISVWKEYLSIWIEGGPLVWLLGLPDIVTYRYADNSYIFLLTKYGLIVGAGVFFSLVIIYRKYINYFRNDSEAYGRLMFWLFFSLLSGMFSDILVSYYYWIMLATFPLMVKRSEKA